ncbi:interleukin-15 receptor subunit alpha isoform X4 [Pseudopipra pipra]|uniref:interleukin-15 receptor subunit alpha isoform X4 n=1 Tax=Pseudopipra pipra TaxID=415032 RepID=UPI003139E555
MRLSQLQGSIQSLHPPLARISWNHGMVWVGRDHKAHPAPAVGRDTFCYPRFFQPGLGHFQGRSRHFPGVPVAIPCVFHPSPARCSRPKAVANAHIEVGNNTGLHSLLRYSCDPGYKRKAGTSNLIQCVLRDGSARPGWTDPTLQCIRDPAAPPPQTPIPVIPTEPHTESTTRRGTSPTSSPSPAGKPGADGTPLDTSTPGEGTTPLPNAPSDNATASSQTLAYSIGFPALLVTGIVASFCCCWRRKTHPRQGYDVTPGDIPMAAPALGNEEVTPGDIPMAAPAPRNEEVAPPGIVPTG